MNSITFSQTRISENAAYFVEKAATIGGATALALSTLQGIALLYQAPINYAFAAVFLGVQISGFALATSKKIDLTFLEKHLRIDHAHTVHDIINSRLLHLPLFGGVATLGLHASPFLMGETNPGGLLIGLTYITSLIILAIKTASALAATVSLIVPVTLTEILFLTANAAYNYRTASINNINFSIKPGYYNPALQNVLADNEADAVRAHKWLECAANQGFEPAQAKLGASLLLGLSGYSQEIQAGIALLKPLAARNNEIAMFYLGSYYYENDSLNEGIDLLIKLGNFQTENPTIKPIILDAQFFLYEYFKNESTDIAQEWLRKAAENGLAKAQYCLGSTIHLNSKPHEALKWLNLAAKQNHPLIPFPKNKFTI